MKNILDTVAKPDNKYFVFLFIVAVNAVVYSNGDHAAAFLSTSFICLTLTYFDYKTQYILTRTLDREEKLINELEKLSITLNKMSPEERTKFRNILYTL